MVTQGQLAVRKLCVHRLYSLSKHANLCRFCSVFTCVHVFCFVWFSFFSLLLQFDIVESRRSHFDSVMIKVFRERAVDFVFIASLVFVQLWARIFFPQFTPLPGLTTCSVSTCLFLPASFYLCASMCSFSVFVAYSCMVVSFESHFFTVSVDCQSFVGSVNGRL